jgi:hypothetical protein
VVQPFWTVVICKTMRCLGSRIISMKVVNVLKKNMFLGHSAFGLAQSLRSGYSGF